MSVESALRTYEDFLLGKASFSLKGPNDIEKENEAGCLENEDIRAERKRRIALVKEKDALEIVRYSITKILCWTPQDAMQSMTPEIMKQLRLDKIISYVQFPKDLSRKKDYIWMIHKAFPNETKYDVVDQTLQLYQRVKNGSLKRFPKRVFEGENGSLKLAILLKDYISKNLSVSSIPELYELFGNTAKANIKMHDAKLYYAYREIYEIPLDYLHESLGKEKDDFLYNFYEYINAVDEVNKNRQRLEREKNKDLRSKSKQL